MVYRTTKCPYCKFYLERGNTSNELEFAPSLLPCPNCGKLFKTGKKMWYEMSEKEKNKFNRKYYGWTSHIYAFLQNLLLMAFIIFIPIIIICSLILKLDDNITFKIAAIIYFTVSVLTIPYFEKQSKIEFEMWKEMSYETFIDKYYKNFK